MTRRIYAGALALSFSIVGGALAQVNGAAPVPGASGAPPVGIPGQTTGAPAANAPPGASVPTTPDVTPGSNYRGSPASGSPSATANPAIANPSGSTQCTGGANSANTQAGNSTNANPACP